MRNMANSIHTWHEREESKKDPRRTSKEVPDGTVVTNLVPQKKKTVGFCPKTSFSLLGDAETNSSENKLHISMANAKWSTTSDITNHLE